MLCLYIIFFFLSEHLKHYIYITTFLKFQTLTPTHIRNIFDWKYKYSTDSNAHIIQQPTKIFTPIDSKVALLDILPIPYKESINNASTTDMQITTPTLWAFM